MLGLPAFREGWAKSLLFSESNITTPRIHLGLVQPCEVHKPTGLHWTRTGQLPVTQHALFLPLDQRSLKVNSFVLQKSLIYGEVTYCGPGHIQD